MWVLSRYCHSQLNIKLPKKEKSRILALLDNERNSSNPAGNYMFKVNNRNTRARCEICSKLTIKISERRHWWFITTKPNTFSMKKNKSSTLTEKYTHVFKFYKAVPLKAI